MIQTEKLMEAIKNRVQIWEFYEIYGTRDKARKEAARLFVKGGNGVQVKQMAKSSFIVLCWSTSSTI